MELLDKLGIDWKLLIAQLVNFAILVFVLYKFLYSPILAILEKRRKQLDENDKRTKTLEDRMTESEQMVEEKMRESQVKASQIIAEAEKNARVMREEILAGAKSESDRFLAEARKQADSERVRMLADIKQEGQSIVMQAVRRVLGTVVDEHVQKSVLKKAEEVLEQAS